MTDSVFISFGKFGYELRPIAPRQDDQVILYSEAKKDLAFVAEDLVGNIVTFDNTDKIDGPHLVLKLLPFTTKSAQ